ncbi:MAG: bacteriohemerythrin [Candidatus Scalindua sp.]
MEMIRWDKSFSVNVLRFDEEHKNIILIINRLIVAMQNNDECEKVSDALNEMTSYAISHFKTEEDYMRRFGYQEYKLHKEEHREFTKTTVGFCKRVMNGNYNIASDLIEYLNHFLANHIQGTDKEYTECFNKNGIY